MDRGPQCRRYLVVQDLLDLDSESRYKIPCLPVITMSVLFRYEDRADCCPGERYDIWVKKSSESKSFLASSMYVSNSYFPVLSGFQVLGL